MWWGLGRRKRRRRIGEGQYGVSEKGLEFGWKYLGKGLLQGVAIVVVVVGGSLRRLVVCRLGCLSPVFAIADSSEAGTEWWLL